MIRALLLLFVASASKGNTLKDHENLKFHVVSSRSIEEAPTIQVTFANGVKDDLELTHYRMNKESAVGCNYIGHLRSNPSSSVAVTGCLNKPGDRMDVTLISKHNTNKMFSVDFDGNAKPIPNPFEEGATSTVKRINRDDGEWQQNGDEEVNEALEQEIELAAVTSIPARLQATIKFGYEQGMKDALGDEDFDSWISSVMTHTRAHYRHSESLGTEIEFEVIGTALFEEGAYWYADDNIYDASAASAAATSSGVDVDVYSWWCQSGGGGTAGIAWLGTLCYQPSGYNTNLNEMQWSAAGSGFVLAHELGHNFGMKHDFDEDHGGWGGPCDNTGIMSYGSYDYDSWSTCSRADWEHHYSYYQWGDTCLDDISDTDTGSTTESGATDGPTEAPGPDVCFNVKTVTATWGHEISWDIGCEDGSCRACVSTETFGNNAEYEQECCLPKHQAEFVVTCKDQWGDGWHGGYLEINGEQYCEEFSSGDEYVDAMPNRELSEACFDVKTVTKSWGEELEWTIGCSDGSCAECESEQAYGDYAEYGQECCFPKEQEEFVITCKDTFGDGWHGGYLEIRGDLFCENFHEGHEYTDEITNGDNTGSEEVCTDIKTVTSQWGSEISWTFGGCSSSEEYGDHSVYSQECCQEAGSYELTCMDSFGDGWHGGYLEIEGTQYCNTFLNGAETTVEATMGGTSPQPTNPPDTDCGIVAGSIVGGDEVTPYSIPWQVGLVSPGGDDPWCGGTIIGPQHILTAAHCMGWDLEVIVGEHNVTDTDDGTRHTICGTTSHPDYNTNTMNNDFAIIRLNEPIELGGRAVRACLPTAEFGGSFLDDKTMTVSGWGDLTQGAQAGSPVLMSVDVPGVSNSECAESYADEEITDHMLCAGQPEGGIDSCQGDSGGPFTYTTGTPARTYIVGVVSWGYGCAWAGYPGVYARVTEVTDWINEQMAITC